jgi:hypothetical protein
MIWSSPPERRVFPSETDLSEGRPRMSHPGDNLSVPRYLQEARIPLPTLDLTRDGTPGPLRAHSPVMIRLKSLNATGALRAVSRAVLVLGLCSMPALGQGRPVPVKGKLILPKSKLTVPPGFAPPAGMCRIWIEGVPADQQPAPTDCATAVKNRPLNGRVIFSDEKATSPKPSKKKSEDESSL